MNLLDCPYALILISEEQVINAWIQGSTPGVAAISRWPIPPRSLAARLTAPDAPSSTIPRVSLDLIWMTRYPVVYGFRVRSAPG